MPLAVVWTATAVYLIYCTIYCCGYRIIKGGGGGGERREEVWEQL